MFVAIADHAYAVRVVRQRLFLDKHERLAIVDHDARRILISGHVPPSRRWMVAAAAVSDAWRHRLSCDASPRRRRQLSIPVRGDVN